MLEIIFAAGGVVSRQTPEGHEIAVIHRPKYNDWCLPKGKLKEGESWEGAAVREVKEEIGCDVRVAGFIGATNYENEGIPKVVFFYDMIAQGECAFQPSKEVDQVLWLVPDEAFNKLEHNEEKDIVNALYNIRKERSSSSLFAKFRAKNSYYRLSSTLNIYQDELDSRVHKNKEENASDEHWVKTAYNLLARAHEALKNRRVDEGWRYFHAARRMEIFNYNAEELKYAAMSLRREAEKLKLWRQNATYDLLGEPGKNNSANILDNNRVFQATVLRDEHYDNEYYKIGLRRVNLLILGIILGLAVVTLPILSRFGVISENLADWREIIAIEVFGILGSVFSVALTLTRSSVNKDIPDQVIGAFITWMRPLIGAAAAVAITIFVKAGILDSVVGDGLTTAPGIFALAFASGFSERLALSALGKISAEEKKEA